MHRKIFNQIIAAAASSALMISATVMPVRFGEILPTAVISDAADNITIDDMPAEFRTAADWIWQNRIEREQSTIRRNTIFDQIVAGKGTVNYVVKWQSYRQITYEQRQKFEKMLSDCINGWNNWLKGYENWPYEHIDVKIVGWAVIDENCLLDLHDDEIVYTDTRFYDSQYDTSNGREEIPDKEPYAPSELSRFDHFTEPDYQYPGGLDKRFDMYMWATQGFPDIGGCGGDWGQRLSDIAYLNMIDSENVHVLEHEIGHGFGMTDFYGGEGESDGFPPGGFPGGENSIMMAGSALKITDFDGWMLRYMWTKIKDEEGRFDIADAQPVTTATTTQTAVNSVTTTQTTNIKVREKRTGQLYLDIDSPYWFASLLREYNSGAGCLYFGDSVEDIDWSKECDIKVKDVTVASARRTNLEWDKRENDIKIVGFKTGETEITFSFDDMDFILRVGVFTTETTTTPQTTTTQQTTQTTTETTTVTSTTIPHFGGNSYKNIEMTVGEEYKVDMRLTDGKDYDYIGSIISVDTSDFDESIAEFDEKTGIITALSPGKTKISFRDFYGNRTEFIIKIFPLGDANCDGKVTIADATAIIQHLGNKDEYALSEQGELNADVVDRGDGVTGADANAVQAIEAGLINQTDFPVAKDDFDALMKSN